MSERSNIVDTIVDIIADYREGDMAAPTGRHVNRWVDQFDADAQLPILREMAHVLRKTYFSRSGTRKFLAGLFKAEKLVGDDPCTFWNGVKLLDIQRGGASQKEMLALFSTVLENECGLNAANCGQVPHAFLYLDDAIFTGNRVKQDLEAWISAEAPVEATVHVVAIALHEGGRYYANRKIMETARENNKKIAVNWWFAIKLEDRKVYTDRSDVLRPTSIPDDELVRTYVAGMGYEPNLRNAGNVGVNRTFSSDVGRQVLEQEFLKAGTRIRSMCPNLNKYQRPLGNMLLDTLGFGSLVVTFRNCPNNAPLPLWVGDPWYALFPRTTNSATSTSRF